MSKPNSNIKWFLDKIYMKGKHGYWDECASSHFKVDNCVDALRARGIKKDEELKSLVLSIGRRGAENRFYVFHLLSDEELDNRAIERHFKSIRNEKINKIRMAEPEELQKEFSAMQGTITPINRKIWNAYTFISPRLLLGRIVSTNDGTLNGWIQFNSNVLLSSPKNNFKDNQIFDFSSPSDKVNKDLHLAQEHNGGLIGQTFNQDDLNEKLQVYYGLFLKSFTNNQTQSNHKEITILDTFFDDTLDDEIIIQMFKDSKKYNFNFNICLLNPLSSAAEERLKALKSYTRFGRINRGFYKIKKCMKGVQQEPFDLDFNESFENSEYVFKQIVEIGSIAKQESLNRVDIRLTNSISFPLILLGDYLFISRFLELSSSRESYWEIYSRLDDRINYFERYVEHAGLIFNKGNSII